MSTSNMMINAIKRHLRRDIHRLKHYDAVV